MYPLHVAPVEQLGLEASEHHDTVFVRLMDRRRGRPSPTMMVHEDVAELGDRLAALDHALRHCR